MEKKPVGTGMKSLKQIEAEVLAEGREWTRRLLEERLKMTICAQSFVTRGREAGLSELIVEPKVGVARRGPRNEQENAERGAG
jgi:hypothetical protein